MDQGPTTVGSIVGRLSMDRDHWLADMQKTKTDVRELGALEPKIKIDADVAAALAKLEQVRRAAEAAGVHTTSSVTATSTPASGSASTGAAAKVDAVAAAERRLALAEAASESATARAIVAEMKFEEQRDKRKRTAAQVAAAELALSEAVKRSDAAATRAALAEDALAAAQRKAAESALAEAAAQETQTAATVKANQANSTNVSRTGMIAAAVAALVPMMVPLAAFTIGAAGALTMMGISGVVAVKGIHDEMAAGTTAGQEYTAGIRELKGDLDTLAHTGAVSMLSSFHTATSDLNNSMPMLNRQVGEFTGFLGRSATNVFAGSLQGARVLEPLMMSIAGWVERLSAGFKSWTGNGGLQTFANYAMATLPQVETTLAAVAQAIMHILEALAPLGTIGLSVLTGISEAINGIPVDVLATLTGAVLAGVGAFKLWGFIAPMLAAVTEAVALTTNSIGLLGVSMEIATGPIGWIVAGVSALVAVFAVSAAATQQATAVTDSYTAALKADSGAIGENVRQQAIQQLMASGTLAAGKQLGISAKLVTDATLGNVPAQIALNSAMGDAAVKAGLYKVSGTGLTDSQKATKASIANVTDALGVNGSALHQSIADLKLTAEANGVTTASTDAQGASVSELAKRYGMTVDEYLAATVTQGKTAAQLKATSDAMKLQGTAAELLKQSLDLLNGKTLSAAGAQNQFDSQIANMSTHINAAGKEINRADTLLEGMTASAVKNRGELIGLTTAAEANAQAFRDNGGSADDTKAKLISMKDEIIKNAIAHGEDADQVQKYVDTLFKIPDTIPPTKLELDAAQASADLAAYQFKLGQIPSLMRTVMTVDQVMGTGVGVLKKADGGTVFGPGTASSDSVPHMLSVGEEVISNKNGQADRNRPLLKAISAGRVPHTLMAGAVAASPAPANSAPSNRPIYAEGSLFGWIREVANGEATFLINRAAGDRKVGLSTGMQRAAF
ncbi:hypothetical protein E3O19_01410 [Cryobacterium algoritolerans]|uniref:Uncharacterized protein n=1 Tax=Cryobacterium algoritolerans TaxID=1259184 RepID=A0A4R8WZ60_9MICO|nr:hypothetical protein [Cryobacterium algoritolerans]TFC20056.1 hypothetical protein E3O19_01410 [Cryobacterium algoritolerans]